jgi:hypothetical protein
MIMKLLVFSIKTDATIIYTNRTALDLAAMACQPD